MKGEIGEMEIKRNKEKGRSGVRGEGGKVREGRKRVEG